MSNNTHRLQMVRPALFLCAFLLTTLDALALKGVYPDNLPVAGSTNWPSGMSRLVNSTNRVRGFFVNAEDLFFFSGTATNLSAFLREYSRIQGIEKHCLILHGGTGKTDSGRPCDWELYGCPKGWHNLAILAGTASVETMRKAAQEPGYILEVHFWTGGHIALDQVTIPKNIEVRKSPAS